MFPSHLIEIKNEPIKREDIDFVVDEFSLQNIVIKCERPDFVDSSELNHYDHNARPTTTICSESEYLADGNVLFESIIVKEEPRLNISNDSTNTFDKNFECYICKYVSGNTGDLRLHIKTHVDTKLLARKRSRKGSSKQSKVTHKRGKKCFACDECGKKFSAQSSLYHHRRIHKGEKMFACDQCDRKCLRKSTLKQHKLIHSGEKPFACNDCDRKFSDSSTLYKHKQTHTGARPFACNLCDRRCSRKSTLNRHLKTHTGEKSFICNVCDKRFSRNSTLNHHKLIHSGENPYECDLCDRKFKVKSTLAYHIQTHSGEKPFICEECDRKFLTKANLNQHKKTHSLSSRPSQHKVNHHKSPQIVGKSVNKPRSRDKKKTKYSILMSKSGLFSEMKRILGPTGPPVGQVP